MERLDVLIIGAGISGIGMACHLKMKHPNRSYTILERRDAIGEGWPRGLLRNLRTRRPLA